MEQRSLGQTSLQVSSYGLGVMPFGAQTGEQDAFGILDRALDAGINFFDTAENYPVPIDPATQGLSETILGRWIKSRGVRDRVVVATKVTGPGNAAGDLNHIRGEQRRLDAANIAQAVEGSLRRLGVDCIDLYQVHWPERTITTLGRPRYSHIPDSPDQVPIEDTLGALDEHVRAGRIRHIGVSNETPWGVMRYLAAAERNHCARIASIQNSYSLLDRYFELGLAEVAMREQVGLIAYSPLSGGVLTGKYLESRAPIPGSRSSLSAGFATRLTDARMTATRAYVELAREYDLDPAVMALAFVHQQPFTTSVLMSASRPEQLIHNLPALTTVLPRDLVQQINRIHAAHPNP